MAATFLKQGLAVFLVASLAVVAPLAGAALTPAGVKCGHVHCPPRTYCCNPSRNLCVRPGILCPVDPPVDGSSATNTKKDVVSSMAGEAVSVRDVSSREEEAAAAATAEEPPYFNCGEAHCEVGQECCNKSCGICTAPGEGCSKKICLPGPFRFKCGHVLCPVGQICCSPSCGICAPRSGVCPRLVCNGNEADV